jgi:hypothetical protein
MFPGSDRIDVESSSLQGAAVQLDPAATSICTWHSKFYVFDIRMLGSLPYNSSNQWITVPNNNCISNKTPLPLKNGGFLQKQSAYRR